MLRTPFEVMCVEAPHISRKNTLSRQMALRESAPLNENVRMLHATNFELICILNQDMF